MTWQRLVLVVSTACGALAVSNLSYAQEESIPLAETEAVSPETWDQPNDQFLNSEQARIAVGTLRSDQ